MSKKKKRKKWKERETLFFFFVGIILTFFFFFFLYCYHVSYIFMYDPLALNEIQRLIFVYFIYLG